MKLRMSTGVKFLLILGLAACSSKPKSSDAPAKSSPPAVHSSGPEPNLNGDDEESQTPAGKNSSEPPQGFKLDKKYAGVARALRQGHGNGLTDETTRLLAADPNDTIALNTLGLFYLKRGKPGAAKIFFNRALEKAPNNAPSTASLYNNLGITFLEEGDQGAAISAFKKALRVDDGDPEALGNLGSIYLKGGDPTKAQSMLAQAYQANRSNLAIANNYAIALRASGDLAGAQRIYDESLKQNSKNVGLLLNYAILLIDYMNKPKDGLQYVYKVKFLETDRKDVLARANGLEKKAKAELK